MMPLNHDDPRNIEESPHEDYVAERAETGHRWRNPLWRHADGSVAEW